LVRPLQQAMPGALVEVLRDTPLTPGKIAFAWRAAVGPAVDRVTAVRLEGRVLIVEASGKAWARELSRSIPIVITRLQTLLGKETVTSLSVRERT
jgi:hypothetical protein